MAKAKSKKKRPVYPDTPSGRALAAVGNLDGEDAKDSDKALAHGEAYQAGSIAGVVEPGANPGGSAPPGVPRRALLPASSPGATSAEREGGRFCPAPSPARGLM
jgi:hypothetical protein